MRKFIPLTVIAICCYCFLQAQQSEVVAIPNFGKEFVKAYQPNDLYEVEIIRADKVGYALQIASLSSYENVVRYVTELQGKWFSNVLMKMDQTTTGQPVYKILLGPFPDRQAATAYKKSMKEEGINGFVTALSSLSSRPLVKAPSKPIRETRAIPSSAETQASTNVQTGEASYYSDKYHGRITASGESFNMFAYTAAHWTLPFNTVLEVCRIDNKKCVVVKVNDRGPNPAKAIGRDGKPRILDLSLAAAEAIGLVEAGVSQVRITPVNKTPLPPIQVERPVVENTAKGQVEQTPPPVIEIETARPSTTPAPFNEKGRGASFTQIGEASFYADLFQNRQTASGELFDMYAYTAAHWTLPFNTKLRVCRLDNKKCVNVRVNDRGPNPQRAIGRDGRPRIIDLSLAAAQAIDLEKAGLAQVRLEIIE